MFVISYSVCPSTPFEHIMLFVGNVKSLTYSGVPTRNFTRVGSELTRKHKTRLETPSMDKHSSFFINYSSKSLSAKFIISHSSYQPKTS